MSIITNKGFSRSLIGMIDKHTNTWVGKVAHSDLNLSGVMDRASSQRERYDRLMSQKKSTLAEIDGILKNPGNMPEVSQRRLERERSSAAAELKSLRAESAAVGGFSQAKEMAGEYWRWMNTGESREQAIKYGITAGAYMGASYAGRAITGGGATYNRDGERDIMGIPFI